LVGKIFLFAAILTGAVLAQDATHTESNIPRKPLQLSSPLTDKNFYLLSLLRRLEHCMTRCLPITRCLKWLSNGMRQS
jgi:hypothetical protein